MQTTNIRNLYHLPSKKIILLTAFFMFTCLCFGQHNIEKHDGRNNERKYSYGIHLAMNQHNFRVEHSNQFLNQQEITGIEGVNNLGMELGLIGILHPIDWLEVRAVPALVFGNRDLNYYDTTADENPVTVTNETTMFDIPLYLKYKSKPYKDFRMFVIGGAKYRANLSYKEASDNPAQEALRLSKSDVLGELGFGAEFHFPLFTLAPEFKVSQGFMNQREPNGAHPYSRNLSALYTRIYSLSINIE